MNKRLFVIVAVASALAATAFLSLSLGSTSIGMEEIARWIIGDELAASSLSIIENVRVPRVVASLLAGGSLAAAGFIIQTVLSNPMASPNVIGVNSGAGFFVLAAACIFPMHAWVGPIAAFCGALVAAGLVFCISAATGSSKLVVVLAGMALTAVFTAGMNTVLLINPDAYVGSARFLTGGLSGVLMKDVMVPGFLIVVGLAIALLLSRRLDLMLLGDASAHSLGLNVPVFRMGMLAVAALLAGSAVCFAGMVGFVGLIVPHVARMLFKSGSRDQLMLSMLLGAGFVTICDLFARIAFAPYEVPVGIVMSFLGGPFFIYLIFKNRRQVSMRE